MINNSIEKAINIQKNNHFFGLFQDIYTLVYCLSIIPIVLYNLYFQTNIINWKIDLFSYIYFIITGIIKLYYLEYNFLLHHIICIGLIWIGNYNYNINYYLWLSKCYLAEISNIFLSGKNILRTLRIKGIIKTKSYENINDILFILTYFVIRIFYLLPNTLVYLYLNSKSEIKFNYLEFITINVLLMGGLNLYWSYLIIVKIIKTYNKKV